MAIFDMDDGYFLDPIDRMMQIVQQFQVSLKRFVGAILNPSKCLLWCADHNIIREYLESNPESHFRAGKIELPGGVTTYRMECKSVACPSGMTPMCKGKCR